MNHSLTVRRALALAAALAILILPAVVLASSAAEGEHAGGNGPLLKDWGLRLVNFAVLVALLVYFVKKPLVGGIRSGVESVQSALREAEESRKAAEDRMRQAEERLSKLNDEVAELLAGARRDAELEKERILAEAVEAVSKIKGEASSALDQEMKKHRDDLRGEAAATAVAAAEEILRRDIKPADQRRFVREYLEKMEAESR